MLGPPQEPLLPEVPTSCTPTVARIAAQAWVINVRFGPIADLRHSGASRRDEPGTWGQVTRPLPLASGSRRRVRNDERANPIQGYTPSFAGWSAGLRPAPMPSFQALAPSAGRRPALQLCRI